MAADLSGGFRVEVMPLVLPAGKFEARLYLPRRGTRTTWRQEGKIVIAETPEAAADDLISALGAGIFP